MGRRFASVAGFAAVLALAVTGLVAAHPTRPAEPGPGRVTATSRAILRLNGSLNESASAEVSHAVAAAGGRVVATEPALDMIVVDVPGTALGSLRAIPGVLAVAPDRAVHTMSQSVDPSTQPGALSNVTRIVGATSMWRNGWTGRGVDIALIDTGVDPVGALSGANKLVIGPDLSFESPDPVLRDLDGYGHGTYIAGIIAGREGSTQSGSSYASDTTHLLGVAPDARLVSLKLAAHDGAVDVSQLIAAIDWVVEYRTSGGLNIKVLNLSLGTDSTQSPQTDPLSWAAEVAWKSGITVVAAAGNGGDGNGGVTDPANNPWVIAVGADDTRGTDSVTDDKVPSFSAHARRQGDRAPDVIAPGVGVVSLAAPGSTVVTSYPAALVGTGYLRGSGTSQAAAVVSGAAALLLSQRTTLKPDQVKALLVSTADPLPRVSSGTQGAGLIDVARAASASPPKSGQTAPSGLGTGTLEGARGSGHVMLQGVTLTGERDIMGRTWRSSTMASEAASRSAWSSDGSFNGVRWTGSGYVQGSLTWSGSTWSGSTWSGSTWSGSTWSGSTWSGSTWSATTWAGDSSTGSGSTGGTSTSNTWTAGAQPARMWSAASWG